MVEIIRNNETGMIEAWRDGEKIGEIHTMGDEANGNESDNQRSQQRS